jgi:hypothetical protein
MKYSVKNVFSVVINVQIVRLVSCTVTNSVDQKSYPPPSTNVTASSENVKTNGHYSFLMQTIKEIQVPELQKHRAFCACRCDIYPSLCVAINSYYTNSKPIHTASSSTDISYNLFRSGTFISRLDL